MVVDTQVGLIEHFGYRHVGVFVHHLGQVLVKVFLAPLGCKAAGVAVEHGQQRLSTHAAKLWHVYVCVLHRAAPARVPVLGNPDAHLGRVLRRHGTGALRLGRALFGGRRLRTGHIRQACPGPGTRHRWRSTRHL